MTYFGFLLWFLGLPILILAIIAAWDQRNDRTLPDRLSNVAPWKAIALMSVVALLYTTLWDNYLVATGVWWYDPQRVTGIVLGWVPIEEYTFFVVQPVLSGMWLFFLARRLNNLAGAQGLNSRLRIILPIAAAVIWLAGMFPLIVGWQPGTYLSLELVWALPPIILQLAFGADILWRYRRLVSIAIATTTLYLSAADAFAIGQGIWTISPEQSLDWLLLGSLPLEEFLFFLVTNVLVVFGLTLLMAQESRERVAKVLATRSRRPTSEDAAN